MGLFEQSKNEVCETDDIMNQISKNLQIKGDQNLTEVENNLLSSLDLEGFQFYIEMIDS